MALLSVTNPPEDYALGYDLFGPVAREYTIFSNWEHIAYADGRFKADLLLRTWDVVHRKVTTMDDRPVPDKGAFYERCRPALLRVLRDLGRFLE
jgi:membrane-anchored protein YejM (alkaline phosphatase superfamily)